MSFEPVYLEPEPARLTEYGKRWMNQRLEDIDTHWHMMRDVLSLRDEEIARWDPIERELRASGVPTALTGQSQYLMAKLGDHSVGKTSFTMPATVTGSLLIVAPTTASTGSTVSGNVATYTGYVILTFTGASWTNAATVATPSVITNASTITWGACTAGSSTIAGFVIGDNATIASANLLWVALVGSVSISTTQTPPTIASGAMSLSTTGS